MPPDPFLIATGPLQSILERLLRLDFARTVYEDARTRTAERFEGRVLDAMHVTPRIEPAETRHIPRSGPLIVAANHPHGALDGLVIAEAVGRVRSDVRLLANRWLARIPELADRCFFVDPFESQHAAVRSQAGLRAAHRWLRHGGALIVFPSGEVAHRLDRRGDPQDSPWKATVGRLALANRAQVLPVFIEGANSRLFYAAGRLHPIVRTILLPRELFRKRGATVAIRIGDAQYGGQLAAGADAGEVTALVRQAVDQLKASPGAAVDVIAPVPTDQLNREIARLPDAACLLTTDTFQVFCADASAVPAVLREIGRLRELTYRAAGEGTGRAVDLDAYDARYLHLFLWDCRAFRVAGAYRLGRTDRIVAEHGIEGLYTRTLFDFDDRFVEHISPALELGRSFVAADYQKNYSALLLLWKGIGRFVIQHPQYRVLFGAVSVSSRYTTSSHQLLVKFLEDSCFDRQLAALVRPVNPPPLTRSVSPPLSSAIHDVDKVISQMESDGKGIPVLLRQYLKLNARLLGFNVDPAFADALDALMMVDLATVHPAILNRYLGPSEAARFLAHHRPRPNTAA